MKKVMYKYKSIAIIAFALIFNLVSSLLVYHPDGHIFNATPMTVTEWICDIVSIICFFVGFLTMMYDMHQNEKEKVEEAIIESYDEVNKSNDK